MSEILKDLRQQVAEHRAVLVVGAGVSIGASGGEAVASWTGLLGHGVALCLEVAANLPKGWEEHRRWQIQSGDTGEMISAAEQIVERLGGVESGEYRRWLRETVGSFTPKRREVLKALGDLGLPLVAVLTGASPRTVRARMARGELPAVKKNGRWRIDRRRLPLTEEQHRGLQAKAEGMRQALEAVLPPRLAATSGQRSRSLADLDAFRLGSELLAELRATGSQSLPSTGVTRLERRLEAALLGLAEAVAHYDRQLKLDALNRSRAGFAQALGLLLFSAGLNPPEAVRRWTLALETEILPAVAGFARWVDGLGRRRQP